MNQNPTPTPLADEQPDRRTRYAAAMAVRDGDTWPTEYESDEQDYLRRADAAIAVADAEQTELRARVAPLTDSERTMLTYALDEAQEHIWSRDGFTDEDQAAVDSLRARAAASASAVAVSGGEQ